MYVLQVKLKSGKWADVRCSRTGERYGWATEEEASKACRHLYPDQSVAQRFGEEQVVRVKEEKELHD